VSREFLPGRFLHLTRAISGGSSPSGPRRGRGTASAGCRNMTNGAAMRRPDIRSVLGFLTLALIGASCGGGTLSPAPDAAADVPPNVCANVGCARRPCAAPAARRRAVAAAARPASATAISSAPIRGATRP
jgi:hypothetical protein